MHRWAFLVFVWLFLSSTALAEVPARLEYQGYLTDSVGTPIHCQNCTIPYNFKFSLYDQQIDGTLLWSELHPEVDITQGVFHVELGLQEGIDAELIEGTTWLEIQVNDQAPMVPRQRLIAVPYALRASVAEHAIESENAASLGGQPVESFVQTVDTDVFVLESELTALLTNLGYLTGDNDVLSDLLCAGGEIAQWDGSSWTCSTVLDALQGHIDTVQINVDTVQANVDTVQGNVDTVQANVDTVQGNLENLDASLNPIAKDGLPTDLADGDDNSQLSEAEVLSMVSGAGYITGDHFSGAWADLTGIPTDIADGDDNNQLSEAEVLSMVSGAGYITGDHFSGAWADLSGIPADIADGDDNTDTTYDGTDFATSNQTCPAGQQMTGIAADGTITCAAGGGLPSGMIAFFAGPCPAGFSEYVALRGRAVLGLPTGGDLEGTTGTSLANLGVRTINQVVGHSHTVDPPSGTTQSVGEHSHSADPGSENSSSAGSHSHHVDPPGAHTDHQGNHRHHGRASPYDGDGHEAQGYPNNDIHRTYRTSDRAPDRQVSKDGMEDSGNHRHWIDIGGFSSHGTSDHTHSFNLSSFNTNGAGSHSHAVDIGSFSSQETGVTEIDVTMPYIQLRACVAD